MGASAAGELSAPAASPVHQSAAGVAAASGAVETTLPPGWVEKFDPKRNKPYYVNAEKRVTQWVRPAAEVAPAAQSTAALDSIKALASDAAVSDLAEGWVEKFDAKKQKPYYVNAAQRKTQWIRPISASAPVGVAAAEEHVGASAAGELSAPAASPMNRSAADVAAAAGDTESELPDGWVEKFDAKKQKPYYVNATKRITQWIRPIKQVDARAPPQALERLTGLVIPTSESSLPLGWVEKFDDTQHHRPYYVNAGKQITQWVRPIASSAAIRDVVDSTTETSSGTSSDGVSAAAASVADASKPDKSQARAMRRAGKKVVRSNEERRESLRKAHGHDKSGLWTDVAQAHKVRWTRPKRRADQTYASILLCDDAREDVEDLLDQMFTAGDKAGSGVLTNMGLNSMVRRRAKGGRLHGNLFAQMHLSKQLDPDDAHAITREMFVKGMLQIMKEDPNGAVAEWIWLEFDNMEEASTDTEDRSGTDSDAN